MLDMHEYLLKILHHTIVKSQIYFTYYMHVNLHVYNK